MAGILASSASKSMVAASSPETQSGYVANERISLSTTPTGDTYAWSLCVPSGSAVARSALSDEGIASPKFTPDVPGVYVITCTVDGSTTYTLTLSVTAVAIVQVAQVFRYSPVEDAAVPTPALGFVQYCSATQGNIMVVKDSSGDIYPIELGSAL